MTIHDKRKGNVERSRDTLRHQKEPFVWRKCSARRSTSLSELSASVDRWSVVTLVAYGSDVAFEDVWRDNSYPTAQSCFTLLQEGHGYSKRSCSCQHVHSWLLKFLAGSCTQWIHVESCGYIATMGSRSNSINVVAGILPRNIVAAYFPRIWPCCEDLDEASGVSTSWEKKPRGLSGYLQRGRFTKFYQFMATKLWGQWQIDPGMSWTSLFQLIGWWKRRRTMKKYIDGPMPHSLFCLEGPINSYVRGTLSHYASLCHFWVGTGCGLHLPLDVSQSSVFTIPRETGDGITMYNPYRFYRNLR